MMYDVYTKPESVEMFKRTGVLSEKEIEARNEVKWEMYVKKVQIESRVLGDLAINHIIPAATRYQSLLLDNVYKIKELYDGEKMAKIASNDLIAIEQMADYISAIRKGVDDMVTKRHIANRKPDERSKAIAYHDDIVPAMEEIRKNIDALELMVDNEIWPLPKYREMLFIR